MTEMLRFPVTDKQHLRIRRLLRLLVETRHRTAALREAVSGEVAQRMKLAEENRQLAIKQELLLDQVVVLHRKLDEERWKGGP